MPENLNTLSPSPAPTSAQVHTNLPAAKSEPLHPALQRYAQLDQRVRTALDLPPSDARDLDAFALARTIAYLFQRFLKACAEAGVDSSAPWIQAVAEADEALSPDAENHTQSIALEPTPEVGAEFRSSTLESDGHTEAATLISMNDARDSASRTPAPGSVAQQRQPEPNPPSRGKAPDEEASAFEPFARELGRGTHDAESTFVRHTSPEIQKDLEVFLQGLRAAEGQGERILVSGQQAGPEADAAVAPASSLEAPDPSERRAGTSRTPSETPAQLLEHTSPDAESRELPHSDAEWIRLVEGEIGKERASPAASASSRASEPVEVTRDHEPGAPSPGAPQAQLSPCVLTSLAAATAETEDAELEQGPRAAPRGKRQRRPARSASSSQLPQEASARTEASTSRQTLEYVAQPSLSPTAPAPDDSDEDEDEGEDIQPQSRPRSRPAGASKRPRNVKPDGRVRFRREGSSDWRSAITQTARKSARAVPVANDSDTEGSSPPPEPEASTSTPARNRGREPTPIPKPPAEIEAARPHIRAILSARDVDWATVSPREVRRRLAARGVGFDAAWVEQRRKALKPIIEEEFDAAHTKWLADQEQENERARARIGSKSKSDSPAPRKRASAETTADASSSKSAAQRTERPKKRKSSANVLDSATLRRDPVASISSAAAIPQDNVATTSQNTTSARSSPLSTQPTAPLSPGITKTKTTPPATSPPTAASKFSIKLRIPSLAERQAVAQKKSKPPSPVVEKPLPPTPPAVTPVASTQAPAASPAPPKRKRSPTPDSDEDEFAASFMRKRRISTSAL